MAPYLHRRDDGALELRVNGVFVMDDRETSTERSMVRAVLADRPTNVLVGGLGLGYMVREFLTDSRIVAVTVAEIEPQIVEWMREGAIPADDLLSDPRLAIEIGDVQDIVAAASNHSFDAIVLDVDNGPDFLVDAANSAVYEAPFVEVCARKIRAGGQLCIWSQADSPALRMVLAEHFRVVEADAIPVRLQGRDEAYWILRGRGPIKQR